MTNWTRDKSHFVFQVLVIFASYTFMQLTTWLPLRFWGIWGGGNFLDSWQVLRYSDCFKEIGLNIYRTDVGVCSNYLYGRSLVQGLNFLGITEGETKLIGFGMMFLFSIIFTSVFPIRSKKNAVYGALILLSPPIMLLLERGNLDLLILGLVWLSSILISHKKYYTALFMIFVSAVIKFYTAPLILLLVLKSKNMIHRISGILIFCLAVLIAYRDIRITSAEYPHGTGAQFGLSIWGEYLNSYNSTRGSDRRNLIISILVFITLLILVKSYSNNLFKNLNIKNLEHWVKNWRIEFALLCVFVFASCYFSGMNYDYRLVYVSIPVLVLYQESRALIHHEVLLRVLILVLWLTYPSGGLEPIGDLILEVCIAIMILLVFKKEILKRIIYNHD